MGRKHSGQRRKNAGYQHVFSFSYHVFNVGNRLFPPGHFKVINSMDYNSAFNTISVVSRTSSHIHMIFWASSVQSEAVKCLAQGNSVEKAQNCQCKTNPRSTVFQLFSA